MLVQIPMKKPKTVLLRKIIINEVNRIGKLSTKNRLPWLSLTCLLTQKVKYHLGQMLIELKLESGNNYRVSYYFPSLSPLEAVTQRDASSIASIFNYHNGY